VGPKTLRISNPVHAIIRSRVPRGRRSIAASIKIKTVGLAGPQGPHGPENIVPTADKRPMLVTLSPVLNSFDTSQI
jgi:hypothetical protein